MTRKSTLFTFLLLVCAVLVSAQDEGVIVKKERIDRSKGIFLALGPSFTLGKNIGDYSVGFNIEAGFLKRMNRIFSIGPSISFVKFNYDQEVTTEGYKNAYIGGPYPDNSGYQYYDGLYYELEGGDISLTSLTLNLKLNLIPVRDNSVISIYGFAKPFVSYSTRTEVTGLATYQQNYGDPGVESDWYFVDELDWTAGNTYVKETYGIDVTQDLKQQSKVTGGIFIGPGIEFFPARVISGFLQASIGYTFPVSFVSTQAYNSNENDLDMLINSGDIEKYPMHKDGFPSVSVQFGVCFSF